MRKEEISEMKANIKTFASSCWMMGIFFLGLKRKAHHPREATLFAKNNNAITLIALVITIIVLLILAGVTISLTLGDEGIFKMAEKSVEETKKAQIKEELETAILEIQSKKIAEGLEITKEDLKELENIGAVVTSTDKSTIVEYKEHTFNIDENYTVTIVNKDDSVKNVNLKELETKGKIKFTGSGGVSSDGTISLSTAPGWSDSYANLEIDEDLHNYSKFSVTFSYIPRLYIPVLD